MLRAIYIDYRLYPFLAKVDKIINRRWPGLKLIDLLVSDIGELRGSVLETIRYIVEKGRAPKPKATSEDEVLLFYVVIVAASLTNNRWLIDRIAIAYSKRAGEFLEKERPENLVLIANKIGIKAFFEHGNCPHIPLGFKRGVIQYRVLPFKITLKDYLKLAQRLAKDPKYSLVNQIVDKGYVYVDKDIFIRLIEEAFTQYIRSLYKPVREIPRELEELVSSINNIVKETRGEQVVQFTSTGEIIVSEELSGVIDEEAFPPCIKVLIDEFRKGGNLSHHARFTLAAFLARIGMSVDDILELFKNAPDFNERIARYQIEHIAGLRGSRKKYMPYNCSTMKSLGICPLVDKDCGVKNPVVYYYRVLYRRAKKNKTGTNSNSRGRK